MPVLVNGEPILNDPIREEGKRLRQRPEWRDLPDGVETSMRVRQEAELRMVDRVLLRQEEGQPANGPRHRGRGDRAAKDRERRMPRLH